MSIELRKAQEIVEDLALVLYNRCSRRHSIEYILKWGLKAVADLERVNPEANVDEIKKAARDYMVEQIRSEPETWSQSWHNLTAPIIFEHLTKQEREIVRLRYGCAMDDREISQSMRIPAQEVSVMRQEMAAKILQIEFQYCG